MKKYLLLIGIMSSYLFHLWIHQQEMTPIPIQQLPTKQIQKSEASVWSSEHFGFSTTSTIAPANSGTPTVRFTTSSQTVSETAGSATVSVQIDCPNTNTSVTVARQSGTATQGSDYTFTSSSLTFSGTTTTQQVSIPLINDTQIESNETLVLRLQNVSGGSTIGSPSTHTLTITSEDTAPPPQVQFISSSQNVLEEDGNLTVTLGISNPNAAATSVQVALDGGTATNGADYTFSSTTVTFPANSSANQTISIPITDDFLVESTETILLKLQNPSNSQATPTLGTTNHTISIADNDIAPSVLFVEGAQDIAESAGTVSIMVAINQPNNVETTVDIVVIGGDATNGADYTFTSPTTVTFPANSSTIQIVDIPIIDDAITENAESMELQLQNANNSVATPSIETAFHIVSIQDNDITPIVSFVDPTQEVSEEVGMTTVMVMITNPNDVETTVEMVVTGGDAINGEDYTFTSPTTIRFPAGSSMTQMVDIPITADFFVENTESITFRLQNASNSSHLPNIDINMHTISIQDNDIAPTLSFVDQAQTIDEAAGMATIMVAITNPNDAMTSVDVVVTAGDATNGADYMFTSPTTLSFPAASSTMQMVDIPITDDFFVENTESIAFRLQNASNSSATPSINTDVHLISIQDNDNAPILNFVDQAQDIDETTGMATIIVGITNPNDVVTRVEVVVTGGDANNGSDYTFTSPTTLTFPAFSSAQQMVTIPIADDSFVEQVESITLSLQNAVNDVATPSIGSDTHIISIIDNDFPIELPLKVFLEGPYNANFSIMSTSLNSQGLLPNDQPFDQAPWNYTTTGDDATATNFPASAVDWVMIQILNGVDMQTVEATRAAFVLSNGMVVDEANNPLIFEALIPNESYYVVVRHRNHIAVISAEAQVLNEGTNDLLDLTQAANVLGGVEQLKMFNNGTGAMKAGDFNANGIISVADFNVLVNQLSQAGYHIGDCTFNGFVGVEDFNFYKPNSSAIGVLLIRY